MENNRLMFVIAGLIMVAFAFTLFQTQPHHMMMYSRVDYTPYFFIVTGIVFMLIPFLESILESSFKKEENVSEVGSKKGEFESVISDKETKSKLQTVKGKVNEDNHNRSNLIREKIDLATKLLSEDESSILKIIHENEGITQDSIHFRTGFSHSKISMIMKKLEEKDLIVRERFGKTYKVYLSEWLTEKVGKKCS